MLNWSIVSFEKKYAKQLIPDARSRQNCNLSNVNDLMAAILLNNAENQQQIMKKKRNFVMDRSECHRYFVMICAKFSFLNLQNAMMV